MKILQQTMKLFFVGLCIFTSSCEKYLRIEMPNDKLQTSSVFSDSLSASLALTGIYANMMASTTGIVASINRFASLSADELNYTLISEEISQFQDNNIHNDNSNINYMWVSVYKHIYQVNSLIEGITNSGGIPSSAKTRLINEAKFIRAFLYFNAVNLWGEIPLITGTDYTVNRSKANISVPEIYGQILADLNDAHSTANAAYSLDEKVRANRFTISSLLAKVSLFLNRWEDAAFYSSEVIESGVYHLTDPEITFLKESEETIFQLYPSTMTTSYNSFDGFYFVPASLTDNIIPVYTVGDGLINSFETGDQRSAKWMGEKTAGNNRYYFPNKYKVQSNTKRTEYTIVFRLAEQYLINAEANAQLNNLPDAIADLNIIRERAGLKNLPATLSQERVLHAVDAERRHEYFCEWGNRWFDLKRTKTADALLKPIKGNNWQPTDIFWPIPLSQLLTNPELNQNQGY